MRGSHTAVRRRTGQARRAAARHGRGGHHVHCGRRGGAARHGAPIGSLTQLAHIRLGKRTEDRNPLIRDFVPLAGLDDIVFGGWDPIPDNAYESALNAGVLNKYEHIEPIADFLKASSRCRRCSTRST
jgi:hypothetical protein